jgi:hypothetical protein
MNIEISPRHDSILEASTPTPVLCVDSPTAIRQLGQPRVSFTEGHTKKLSVMVPKSFHKQLRLYCTEKDLTITEVVLLALRCYIAND